jgi:tetratricopeptide (TPR) repeat protein/predicted Ser/Thr protein kinase
MARASETDSGGPQSLEPTWLPDFDRPALGDAEFELARERLASSMFPEVRDATRIGRYVVLERVGTGGMGVVYAAYDPELDRKVAIKILHALHHDALLHEARTLAKLSHPHVVAVHDVGTFDLRGHEVMFVAMEFIAGSTLTSWLRERSRSQREVLDLLLEAARGLAAAHAVGIVHRDFKPDNVLVDADGHAHVVDFGLAHAPIGSTPVEGATPLYGGTPGYMSPEQLSGVSTDARTDQFSFCVTLWEALYGERPHKGGSLLELAANMLTGERRAPPNVAVPRWLRAAIERGLAVDPADRWPSLDALGDALARGRSRARRVRGIAILGGLGLVIAGVVGVRMLDEQRRIAACEGIDVAWNDEQRAAVRAGLIDTGAPDAAITADKLMPWLDEQADALRGARTRACLAHDVQHTWTPDMLDRASWCLDERELELDALVTELRSPDAPALASAVQAAAALRRVDTCIDASLLERLPAPPTRARDEVQAIRAELSRARALDATGAYAEGLAVAEASLHRAQDVAWPPLVATARNQVGNGLHNCGEFAEAEAMYEAAYFEAEMAGATEDAFEAAIGAARTVGSELARYPEGERWAKLADLALADLPDPARLREARALSVRSHLRLRESAYAEAISLAERALEIRETSLGPAHPSVAAGLRGLAVTKYSTGDFDEAASLYERARQISVRTLGPEHPEVGVILDHLGLVHEAKGELAEAEALHERALALVERTLGPEHPHTAASLTNLAVVRERMGDPKGASELYERALAINEKTVGTEHPGYAAALANLATSIATMGRYEEAAKLHEQALAINERRLGPDHPDVAKNLQSLSVARSNLGAKVEAETLLERAIAIHERKLGPDHPNVAEGLYNLAVLRHAAGDDAGMLALTERAGRIWEKSVGLDHPYVVAAALNVGSAHEYLGQYEEARAAYRHAVELWERIERPPGRELAVLMVALATVELELGRPHEALAFAERALAATEAAGPLPSDRADARFVLARALVETGGSEAKALSLAREARALYGEMEPPNAELTKIDTWLRARE